METLHWVLEQTVSCGILLFEFSGLFIVILACLKGLYSYVKKKPGTKLGLARGLELGLEFKLGGEILRTVIVRDIGEIFTVGSIILLRALLTFLIHWEIQNEEKGGQAGSGDVE